MQADWVNPLVCDFPPFKLSHRPFKLPWCYPGTPKKLEEPTETLDLIITPYPANYYSEDWNGQHTGLS